MQVDYTISRRKADRMIRDHGMTAVLRRNGAPDRQVSACFIAFSPMENLKITDPTDRKVLVSALDPNDDTAVIDPPDFVKDRLVTFAQPPGDPPVEAENLRIVAPPGRVAPGDTVVFWRLVVRA